MGTKSYQVIGIKAKAAPPGGPVVNVDLELTLAPHSRDPRQVRDNLARAVGEFFEGVMAEVVAKVEGQGYVRVGPTMPAPPPEPVEVAWVKMTPAVFTDDTVALMAAAAGGSGLDAAATRRELEESRVFMNDRYTAIVRLMDPSPGRPQMAHLSVRRNDRAACHDWRDLQRLKNDIFGPESEGAELYPAESRLADAANQYHMWVIVEPGIRFPFGFADRLVDGTMPTTGAVQRPFHPANAPGDVEGTPGASLLTRYQTTNAADPVTTQP